MKKYITYAKTNDAVLPYEERHRQIAYRAATEGIVLLENDGTLPVMPGKIALYGAGAAYTIKGGTGSGEVNERYSVNILEGMENAGFEITTKNWIRDYVKEYKSGLKQVEKEIRQAMKTLDIAAYGNLFLKSCLYPFGRQITARDVKESDTDTCIYVVARQSGEGTDRKLENNDFYLSEIEKSNIKFCTEHYEKTIVVLNVGSSFDTGFMKEIPKINALIYLCQPGTEGGNAFADVVSGKVTPSGKLTDTWVKSYKDVPFGCSYSYLNGDLENEDYLEDIYVGYRYYDTFSVEPAYPFGYGLSYTDFNISFVRAEQKKDIFTVYAKVKNTGDTFSGKEIVQLYASCPQGRLKKEYQRLCAFAKTSELNPGEEEILSLTFPASSLTSYEESSASFLLEKGSYLFHLGDSSRNAKTCVAIHIPEEICVSRHRNICPQTRTLNVLAPDFHTTPDTNDANTDAESDFLNTVEMLSSAAHFQLLPDDIKTVVHTYKELPVCRSEKLTNKLKSILPSDRIDLVVGAGIKDMLMNSSYIKVPGVAGNTTSRLVKKGIPNIALADGPAGLRVQRRSTITPNGTAKMIDMQFDMMKYFPVFVKKIFCGNPEKDKIYYQYATAFPVATAMAQTWNTDLLEEIGSAVGEEMQEYGVTFWLAPGLNIHRNPLCGRNYEYYSEDPFLSGKMAAAITKGLQKNKGCFVTVKHFCANNQEENREHVSSNMTERALREIYLRGFEIAVREGKAKGLMSSYNKVNGVYTSNSKDLLTDVLRNEWNFSGLVMTDWTATAKGKSDPAGCIAAGNDLIMPGSSRDKSIIKKALKNGSLSRRDLNRCAGNVLCSVLEGRMDKK